MIGAPNLFGGFSFICSCYPFFGLVKVCFPQQSFSSRLWRCSATDDRCQHYVQVVLSCLASKGRNVKLLQDKGVQGGKQGATIPCKLSGWKYLSDAATSLLELICACSLRLRKRSKTANIQVLSGFISFKIPYLPQLRESCIQYLNNVSIMFSNPACRFCLTIFTITLCTNPDCRYDLLDT